MDRTPGAAARRSSSNGYRVVLMMREDMDYGLLSARAEAAGFRRVDRKQNVEVWWTGL
jgi:hypothetical protein